MQRYRNIWITGISLMCVTLLVVLQTCSEVKDPQEIALKELVNVYKMSEKSIISTKIEKVSGLIVTVPRQGDSSETIFLVTFSEKKLNRATTIGTPSSEWKGKSWTSDLTDEEFIALGQVNFTMNVRVRSNLLKEIVRSKVIPSVGAADQLRLRETYLVRAVTLHAVHFELEYKLQLGPNLNGVTFYIDKKGEVLARANFITHAD